VARDRQLERGHTFVELMVVVAIAATLLFLAVPVMQSSDTVGASVREVTGDAIEARSLAKANWSTVTLDFDVANSRWRKLLGGTVPVITEQTDPSGWRFLPDDVVFQSVAGSNFDPIFQANGRVDAEMTIRMVSGTTVWEVQFQELTGRISAQRL
jgi:Tfp pilus assembly protein FimT